MILGSDHYQHHLELFDCLYRMGFSTWHDDHFRVIKREEWCRGKIKMSVHRIPIDKLTPEALQRVIEEVISRDGTDYGEIEASSDTKFRQVKSKLATGEAVLIFDDETETTNIFLANDPALQKLD